MHPINLNRSWAGAGWKLKALALGLLALGCSLAVGAQAASPRPDNAGQILEELHYKVDIWIFNDSVPAKMAFKRLGPKRYRAEISGQARGLLGLLSGNFRGQYTTDMVFADGQFKPAVYREQTERRGKLHVVEYRFDYQEKRVEVWKWDRGKRALVKKWEGPLDKPMYDPLSFYYNRRLHLGEVKEGDIVRLPTIPYPKPEEVVFLVGPLTPEGRQVTITLDDHILDTEGKQIFALLDPDGVATRAWTRLMRFGKVSGTLLPGGKRLKPQEILKADGGPGTVREPASPQNLAGEGLHPGGLTLPGGSS